MTQPTMMAGLSNSLGGSLEPEAASGETLASVLDAGGVSSGALYLTGPDGRLRLHVESGFGQAGAQEVAGFFGHPELFDRILETEAPIALLDGSVPEPAAHDFLARAGVRSAVVVPVRARGECLGVLLLGSGQRDLGQKDRVMVAQSMAGQVGQTIALSRAFFRLAASEQRYRTLFSNIPVGLFRTTPDGRILEANPACVELLGYPDRETLLAMNVGAFYVDPGDRVRALAIAQRDGRVRSFETRYRRADGGSLWVSLRAVEEDGETLYEGSFESITERQLTEEQMERPRTSLVQTEKLAAMGQLLAGVAHELSTPLSVVVGHAHLLQVRAQGSPLAERATKISKAADRCARIVKNVLALAREQPPERGAVKLNAVVKEAIDLLAYPLRTDGVEVTLDLDPDPATLWADPHQLHQVVVNLVTNAHQAMRETPAPRRLRIATRSEGRRRVILTVADSGPGVPALIRERILEPFFTTKPAGQGTGLGLSLCHGVIEEHGGTIAIDDAPGGGALFRIELPVEWPSRAEPAGPRVEEPAGPSGLHILVVDDEVEVAELLQEVLESCGHHVETARNGQVALDRLGERAFDLILSDVKMPVLDGPGLYQEIERRHPGLERRILFMTGDSLSVDVRQFLERSGMPTLAKPFVPADVFRAINRAATLAAGGAA